MADEARELQARIDAISSRISKHKAEAATTHHPPYDVSHRIHDPYAHTWKPRRGTPYGVPASYRGRGDYGAAARYPATHRNRTLVVNNNNNPANEVKQEKHDGGGGTSAAWPSAAARHPAAHRNRTLVVNNNSNNPTEAKQEQQDGGSGGSGGGGVSAGWVTKSDRHLQLINNTVYDKKVQQRTQAIEQTRKMKESARTQKDLATVQKLSRTADSSSAARHIVVEGIDFLVTSGGNKLIKFKNGANEYLDTPKRAEVSGVVFYRSKHGNLYRAGLIKTTRREAGTTKIDRPCLQFSTTGSCVKGPSCRYIHDPEKVAMCKEFLQKGECRAGAYCDLSHDPTPERVPACLHFLRGSCTKDECRYAHVAVDPGAPVCRAFATYGFCARGAECPERHVHECPDYADKGFCRNKSCHLPHIDRAGKLRKAAAAASGEDDASDISSEGGGDSDDVDSDEFDEDMMGALTDNTELSGQADFVRL